MKIHKIKTLLVCLFIAFIPSLFASSQEAKIIEQNVSFTSSNMIIMEDNSIWMIFPVSKRKQTWKEWWNKVTPDQPEENFSFSFNDWRMGTSVYVKEHYWTEENRSEMNKYNQPQIAYCTHILENPFNQQMAFARPMMLVEAVDHFLKFAKDCYKEGEDKGYQHGHRNGYDEGKVFGKKIGQDVGYAKGLQIGQERGAADGNKQGYDKGYQEGYDVGYTDGYQVSQYESANPPVNPNYVNPNIGN